MYETFKRDDKRFREVGRKEKVNVECSIKMMVGKKNMGWVRACVRQTFVCVCKREREREVWRKKGEGSRIVIIELFIKCFRQIGPGVGGDGGRGWSGEEEYGLSKGV